MANQWFRMYSEFMDDPKVQMMTEADQRRLVMLFCERCKGVEHDETLRAFHWRVSPLELNVTKQLFIAKGFIDGDWNLLNWNRRQYISDNSSERVRRHRQRLKQNETLHHPNVTAPDTETDSEPEQKEQREPANEVTVAAVVSQVVLAHPRSRLRDWQAADIPYGEAVATLQAVDAEAARGKVSRMDAALLILGWVEAIASAVPRDQWQFIKPVPEFMRLREYRIDPKVFIRKENNGSDSQNQPPRVSPAEQRGRESRANILKAAAARYGPLPGAHDGAGAGGEAEPDASGGDAGYVPGGVGGDGSAVRAGAVSGRVIDGNARR